MVISKPVRKMFIYPSFKVKFKFIWVVISTSPRTVLIHPCLGYVKTVLKLHLTSIGRFFQFPLERRGLLGSSFNSTMLIYPSIFQTSSQRCLFATFFYPYSRLVWVVVSNSPRMLFLSLYFSFPHLIIKKYLSLWVLFQFPLERSLFTH